MTFDRSHLVLQWGGTLPGGEQWTCGLRLAGGNTGPDPLGFPTHSAIADALNGFIGDAVQAWHQNAGGSIGSAAKLIYAKLNAVDENGHYRDDTTIQRTYGSGLAGGGGAGIVHPTQVCLVVSLTTAVARGHAHRGRFYQPMPNVAVDASTGLISIGDATSTGNAAVTFINALSSATITDPLGGFNVCVMSKSGSGATHEVTGVEIGRVLDTQRRRRRSLPETYVPVPR